MQETWNYLFFNCSAYLKALTLQKNLDFKLLKVGNLFRADLKSYRSWNFFGCQLKVVSWRPFKVYSVLPYYIK